MRTLLCVLLGAALLHGCGAPRALGLTSEPLPPETSFPLKIGLLADSQLTSQNGHADFHYRSKTADALVEVSIRPPALEYVLAEEMLDVALAKLSADDVGPHPGVDVILYLGDAANSGGADEIDAVLTALDAHRRRTGTPIFIVIGNHDYLGAGNITNHGLRFAMLNREGRSENPVLTKYDVLERFSAFNHASAGLAPRFDYVDNIEDVRRHADRNHDTGLYLSGVVTYRVAGADRAQIFLLDTSDYKDAPDWSAAAGLGFYGVIGSVSFKDEPGFVAQTSYLQSFAAASNPEYRILASHYPKDHLDRITFAKPGEVPLNLTNFVWDVTDAAVTLPTFSETLNANLAALLTDGPRNYWVSGHTHVPTVPRPERFAVAGLVGERYFRGMNVGSTTDYRAHVAILEPYARRRNVRLDDAVGYRELPLAACDDDLLAVLPSAVGTYGRDHVDDPVFQSLIPPRDEWIDVARRGGWLDDVGRALTFRGERDTSGEERYWIEVGAIILGLDKTYREPAWTLAQTEASADHLRAFIERFVGETSHDRDDVVCSLGLLAGAYESERLDETTGFDLKSMRRICADAR